MMLGIHMFVSISALLMFWLTLFDGGGLSVFPYEVALK